MKQMGPHGGVQSQRTLLLWQVQMGTESSTRFKWNYLDIPGLLILILQEMFFKVWWTFFEDGTLIPFFNYLHFEGPHGHCVNKP